MAIAFVQQIASSAHNDNVINPVVVTPSANTSVSNLLVLTVVGEEVITAVSDSFGGSWTQVPSASGHDFIKSQIWIGDGGVGTSGSISITKALATDRPHSWIVDEWSGLNAEASAIDVSAANPASAQPFANTSDTGTTATTTQADTLAIAMFAFSDPASPVEPTPPSGFTLRGTQVSGFGGSNLANLRQNTYYRINSSAGTQTASLTTTGTPYYGNVIVALKASGGGGGGVGTPAPVQIIRSNIRLGP